MSHKNTPSKFWERVEGMGTLGCWNWPGRDRGPSGYGGISWHGREYYAHRVAFCLAHGMAPMSLSPDIGVLHTCDNRRCCNPDHLWLGTNDDNVADKVRKGRQSRLRGPRNPKSKLTPEAVHVIRSEARRGVLGTALARRFGISSTSV